jgi:hypothetical protein
VLSFISCLSAEAAFSNQAMPIKHAVQQIVGTLRGRVYRSHCFGSIRISFVQAPLQFSSHT